jgi:TM2 domain-containing membrane protein YozV
MSQPDNTTPVPGTARSDESAGEARGNTFSGADIDLGNLTGRPTHNVVIAYVLWIFGFLGSHRFYFGKPVSGTIYFFTLGLLFIGWIVDLFLIPNMARNVKSDYVRGPNDYSIAWLLLTFTGVFGVHRFYLGKIFTGIVYLLTVGLFLVGLIYDFWTLNEQISESNEAAL